MPDKTAQLKSLLTLLEASVTKSEFSDAVKTLVSFVKDIRTGNEKEWALIKSAISMLGDKLSQENATKITDEISRVEKKLSTPILNALKEQETGMKFIYDKVAKLESGVDGDTGADGHTPTEEELLTIIKPLIPQVTNGKDAEPVDIEALEQRIMRRFNNIPRPHGGQAAHPMKFYDLSSQTNGSLKVFSIPKSVNAVVFTSDFPYVLIEGNGFIMDAARTTLTLTVQNAPSAEAQLLLQYSSTFNSTT